MTWWRRRRTEQPLYPPPRLPDGDTVPYPDGRRWTDLIGPDGLDPDTRARLNEPTRPDEPTWPDEPTRLDGPTRLLPIVGGPFLTLAQWWRGTRGGRQ